MMSDLCIGVFGAFLIWIIGDWLMEQGMKQE